MHQPSQNSMIVLLIRSPSALLFPKHRGKSMAPVSKVFRAVLWKNVFLNNAVPLNKYDYYINYFLVYNNTTVTQ
jgi:hypothetical protein